MLQKKRTPLYQAFLDAEPFVLSFAYRGAFSDDMTASFVDISENTITDHKGLPKVSKKVSFLLVESFQNIIRHADLHESGVSRKKDDGIFSFRNMQDQYSINGINFVSTSDITPLTQAIESVNNACKEDLKAMYTDKLSNGDFSSKGGAGLGFIELARKSKQKIKYKIENDGGAKHAFHQQTSFVNGEGIEAKSYIEETNDVYRSMLDNSTILLYKGDFSQRSILPIIQILETNFGQSSKEINKRKRMIHLLVEMLQNVSKHGAIYNGSNDGIFSISEVDDVISIEIGNLVLKKDIVPLCDRLGKITEADDTKLKIMHREQLLESIKSADKKNSGLGLIEIAKYSSSKLQFGLHKLNSELSFFSLRASA